MLRRIEAVLPWSPVAAIFGVILYEAIFEKTRSLILPGAEIGRCRRCGRIAGGLARGSCRFVARKSRHSVGRNSRARPGRSRSHDIFAPDRYAFDRLRRHLQHRRVCIDARRMATNAGKYRRTVFDHGRQLFQMELRIRLHLGTLVRLDHLQSVFRPRHHLLDEHPMAQSRRLGASAATSRAGQDHDLLPDPSVVVVVEPVLPRTCRRRIASGHPVRCACFRRHVLPPVHDALEHHRARIDRTISPGHNGRGELHHLLFDHRGARSAAPRAGNRHCRGGHGPVLGSSTRRQPISSSI